jgi:DNA-binding transcriptional regulator YiaG
MINIEKLLDSACVEISVARPRIDKEFVKEFREKNSLSQTALAVIFCVKKGTVEKWEKGEKEIKGSDAMLFKVLNDNPEILSQIYSVRLISREKKREKEIPKKYMFKGSYEGGSFREISPIGKEINKKTLEEIECPCCGKRYLEIKNYSEPYVFEKYIVECNHCYWQTPTGFIGDYGEAPSEFKWWLEAFHLLGRPKEKVNEDLTLFFYPEGEWREKEKEEREKERKEEE